MFKKDLIHVCLSVVWMVHRGSKCCLPLRLLVYPCSSILGHSPSAGHGPYTYMYMCNDHKIIIYWNQKETVYIIYIVWNVNGNTFGIKMYDIFIG